MGLPVGQTYRIDIRFMVLRDAADTDMEIYRNLELYFEEIK